MEKKKGTDKMKMRLKVTVYLKVGSEDDKTTIDLLLDDKRYYRVI